MPHQPERTPEPRIHPLLTTQGDGPSNPTTSAQQVTLTLTRSGHNTAPQTTIPLIFGCMPPMTNVLATTTATRTHYSTVMTIRPLITQARSTSNEYDAWLKNSECFDAAIWRTTIYI